jgi:hypothetical protein
VSHVYVPLRKPHAFGFQFLLLDERPAERETAGAKAFCINYAVARSKTVVWIFMKCVSNIPAQVAVSGKGCDL